MPPKDAKQADVIFLGELHDNPAHHALQAAWVQHLQPRALVFEMLTPSQAERVTTENRAQEAELEAALGWAESGWPDFSMYYPIFAAALEAAIFGAGVPRSQLRSVMGQELATVVGPEVAERFELDTALPEEQQKQREHLQRVAHCDALPVELLPRMVNVQRLRDAALAQAAFDALDEFGAPVVVITGNGHAREDWGAPFLMRLAEPEVLIYSLAQGEAGQAPAGGFDAVVDAPSVDRGDPCDAFN